MKKITDLEYTSRKEFQLDFSDTLEHPVKSGRYLQYRCTKCGKFHVREIEVDHNGIISVLIEKTIDSTEFDRIEYPYNESNYEQDFLPA